MPDDHEEQDGALRQVDRLFPDEVGPSDAGIPGKGLEEGRKQLLADSVGFEGILDAGSLPFLPGQIGLDLRAVSQGPGAIRLWSAPVLEVLPSGPGQGFPVEGIFRLQFRRQGFRLGPPPLAEDWGL